MAPINWDECELLPRFECSVCATCVVPWGRTLDDRYFCSSHCAHADATTIAAMPDHDAIEPLPRVNTNARRGLRRDGRPRYGDRSARCGGSPVEDSGINGINGVRLWNQWGQTRLIADKRRINQESIESDPV